MLETIFHSRYRNAAMEHTTNASAVGQLTEDPLSWILGYLSNPKYGNHVALFQTWNL